MNSKKLYYGLILSLFVITAAGISAFTLGDGMLKKQNSRLNQLKLESSNLEAVQSSLVDAKKDIVDYASIEQIAKTVVPQEKDQAKTVREIIKLAQESGIPISSITFPNSTLGNKAPGKATGQAPTAAASPSAVTQTQKVEGISGVERLEITISSDTSSPVPYSNFLRFLEKLEQNRRTSQVSGITIVPDSKNRNVLTFSLLLNVYIKK